jgi:hypothetical protein
MHRTDAEAHMNNKYTDGGPGVPATVFDANAANSLQEELCKTIEEAGITLYGSGSADLWDQLSPALRGHHRDHPVYLTTGSASAYAITTDPPISALAAGMKFWINPHVENSAAPTLNVDGTGAIQLRDTSTLQIKASHLKAGYPHLIWTNGTYWFVISESDHEIIKARGAGDLLDDRLKYIMSNSDPSYLNSSCHHGLIQAWARIRPGSGDILNNIQSVSNEQHSIGQQPEHGRVSFHLYHMDSGHLEHIDKRALLGADRL